MQVVGSVLFGADEIVAKFVNNLVPHSGAADYSSKMYVALGVIKNDELVGGVVYYNYRHHDIEFAAAFTNRRWTTRTTLQTLFGYPFHQLSCVRATAIIGRKNKPARDAAEKSGFKVEGVKRRGFDGKQDAIMYGLLKSDCKWLG